MHLALVYDASGGASGKFCYATTATPIQPSRTAGLAGIFLLQALEAMCYYENDGLLSKPDSGAGPGARSAPLGTKDWLLHHFVVETEGFLMADMLETMFELQKNLNKRVGVDTDSMDDDERAKWILNYARALGQELAELVDSVPWKWWAQYQTFDKHNAKVEIIDMFHFLMSLALTLGLSAKDVFEAYLKKNKVNFERQEQGYLFKDESDNLEI